jgi:putative Holliday junction resolvase
MTVTTSIIALDVGAARIGVALANTIARLASPLTTLPNNDAFFSALQQIIDEHQVSKLIVGLPRNLNGQNTEQTNYVEQFVSDLRVHTDLPIQLQDEAVTSKQAEAELQARGKAYTKEAIDSLSATYILEDYLREGATR